MLALPLNDADCGAPRGMERQTMSNARWLAGFVLWMLALPGTGVASGGEPIIIPFVTDPSPMIDGNLSEWTTRGALRELVGREHATFSPEEWRGNEDLSGWARFGHDADNLYVAAHVVDDVFVQDQASVEAWRGDHIMLTVDMKRFGRIEDIWQLGLSPGNLAAESALPPELIIWEPLEKSIAGAKVAAQRTSDGYEIEASIPWRVLEVGFTPFMTFGLQLGFSDCDTTPATQEKGVSISTAPWRARDPDRLTAAGLADRSGNFPLDAFADATVLAESALLEHKQELSLTIDVDSLPQGRVPTLTFMGRVQWENVGGCCGPLRITVNGKSINPANIAERPPVMQFIGGGTQTSWYGAGVVMWYGNSYEQIEASRYKPLDVVAYEYTLRLDDMFHEGENTITFANVDPRENIAVALDDIALAWSSPSRFRKPKVYAPAPTGELPVIEPWTECKVDYRADVLPGGAVRVAWSGRELTFESQWSIPEGGWARMTADTSTGFDDLHVERTIERRDECILVRDVLINESEQDRPVIVTHQTTIDGYENLYLGGRPIPMKTGAAASPENPTIFVIGDDSAVGMMPVDDVFRIHYRGSFDGSVMEISDRSLVLRPGVRYEQQWLIVPVDKPDYWRGINALRRYFDNNFTIDGSFTFFGLHPVDLPLMPWQVEPYLDGKNARYVSVVLGESYKGLFPHGPHKRDMDPTKARTTNALIRAVRPQTKLLSYFNTFDCAWRDGDPDRWTDCRVLLPDGSQVRNGANYPLFFATLENEYGRELDANVEWLINEVGADGLYWDCYAYYHLDHYGDTWDGWTASINPDTHTITRKRSSTTLLTWPYREKITRRILEDGRPLVANTNPVLTSEYRYHFPRFVETADISAVTRAHLFTPIALGDHVTERTEVDCYRWMLRSLDYGGLYYWYSGRIQATHETLTSVMFPITIRELHEGYILGDERILTNRSGIFGFGDASPLDVTVFNRVGQRTDEIEVPTIERDGKRYVELRIPEGYSAAVVRR
jgi:hypothetical protein